jgi:4-amino-4-deoxychorismate lyase
MIRYPWPDSPDHLSGIRVRLCETRLGHNSTLAGIKHLNRLEQVLARAEWKDAGISEGLMRDHNGNIVEGITSNVFLVQQGVLHTPSLDHCGVEGIMRGVILELATTLGIPNQVMPVSLQQLREAEEVFISNSLIGLWPVRTIDDLADYTIGEIGTTLRQQLTEMHSS